MRVYKTFRSLFIDPNESVKEQDAIDRIAKPLFWLLVVAATWIGIALVIDIRFGLDEDSPLGTFGDFFGGVLNPIFTFLTVFGLIVTIVIQRTELRLSRDEYSKTNAALTTQAVENTFFNTLDLHHKIADSLRLEIDSLPDAERARLMNLAGISTRSKRTVVGREVFDTVVEEIQVRHKSPSGVMTFYQLLQNKHNHILGHYFRNLYQALKVIDSYEESNLSERQKRKYASILRAQLSSSELALLYLNCSGTTVDEGQFRELLIRYRMLEHLPLKLSNGVYRAGQIGLAIATEESIKEYLAEEPSAAHPGYRGAFGRNPERLPGDA